MIVVDASAVVLALLADGEARAMLSVETVVCPHLTDSEIAQSLRRLVHQGEIEAQHAQRALAVWAAMGVERVGVVGLLDRIWELRDNVSAYDATYVAVAETMGAPLLTADGRLASAPGPRCPITVIRS